MDAKALRGDLPPEDRQRTIDRLSSSLAEQVFGLAIVARCLLPFLPTAATELHTKLGLQLPEKYRDRIFLDGVKTASEAVLFPRRVA